MVYQGFNKVATLPKRKLKLDLTEKPLWWKSRVHLSNFIKSGLQL